MAAMSPEEVVAELLDRFRKGDVDGMVELFADDAVYHNMPLEPAVGAAAIRELLGGFAGMMVDLTIDVTNQLAGGALVMQERIDCLHHGRDACVGARLRRVRDRGRTHPALARVLRHEPGLRPVAHPLAQAPGETDQRAFACPSRRGQGPVRRGRRLGRGGSWRRGGSSIGVEVLE